VVRSVTSSTVGCRPKGLHNASPQETILLNRDISTIQPAGHIPRSMLKMVRLPKLATTALLFALCTAVACYVYGWQSMIFTYSVATITLLLYKLFNRRPLARELLAYCLFLLTPLLTSINALNTLTGLDPSGAQRYFFGITFASAALGAHVYTSNLRLRSTFLDIVQPIRLYSGPLALPSGMTIRGRLSTRRFAYYGGWLNLGLFFFFGLAPAFLPLLELRRSFNCLDIWLFAAAYELYVYFNFAGISFIAYAVLRISGCDAVLNFNTPFAARNVIEYWQRWHISLSQVCKLLFFGPARARLGLGGAVASVFFASAMWHGTSWNFLLWGIFHASAWLGTYLLVKRSSWGGVLTLLLFPFIVVLGRLLFSEVDPYLLSRKLFSLATMEMSEPLIVRELVFSKSELFLVGLAIAVVAAEVSNLLLFRRYKVYRVGWNSIIILLLTVLFGSAGMGGVYGTR
jgi:alginate O-acetyltransferase complex protein AlgI